MPRFFVNEKSISSNNINITGEDINHIKKVLRLKKGDTIIVSDSNRSEYLVEIDAFETDCVITKIINKTENRTEPPIDVILYQGLPKADKMELIIQKSVELGIKCIVPVITERTVVKLNSDKDIASKLSRWQRIAFEAAKQCERGIIPQVQSPLRLEEAFKHASKSSLGIIPYEKENTSGLKNLIYKNGILDKSIKEISVYIGPEGGFAQEEVEKAIQNNIKPLSLGPRILRTETAGIAVLSILMYEFGDVNI